MRFLFRLGVLALAAVGAKALYDRFAPKANELRGPAGDVIDSAKSAAIDVTQRAKDAAIGVADDAKQRASQVRDQAETAAEDAPTVATPKASAHA
jgi:hypothetical protein